MSPTRRSMAALALASLLPAALGAQRIAYPETRRADQVDDYHGTRVADPFRWLEDTDAPETRAWIEAQNRITQGYLAAIPQRDAIRRRLTELWNSPRWSAPSKRGGRYFYSRNDGLQPQAVLYVQPTLTAQPRVLLDPNTLSTDGTVALSITSVSEDGKLLAYGVASGGSDWQEFRVRDVDTGRDLPDQLKWIKFSGATWTHDGRGFFYSRYPEPQGNALTSQVRGHRVYYHRLGTEQSRDVLVFERPAEPDLILGTRVSEDGRYLLVTLQKGTDPRARVHVLDLQDAASPRVQGTPVALFDTGDATYSYVWNEGPVFYFSTDKDAELGRMVAVDLRDPAPARWRTVIAEGQESLQSAWRAGDRFVTHVLRDASSRLRVHGADGTVQREIQLPALGAVGTVSAQPGDPELFFSFASFLYPSTIFRTDLAAGTTAPLWAPRTGFQADRYVTKQVFYRSKDGTRVPMFVTHRRDLAMDGTNPTLLTGYGGFNVPQLPGYAASYAVWLEMGGVLAVAALRGGGEYGDEWYDAGRLTKKQNVFDDFIAAGEYLVSERYTQPSRLAIAGGSNGGLLVGAVLNQRPDLFGAALPAVGVMDMLRFHKFTIGWAWASDYGTSEDPAQFRTLMAYSPLHNLKPGTRYPAVLVTTGDHDDRVVPGHSFKYAATLQAAQAGDAPVLIRVQTRAGHGAGKPTAVQIEEAADRWAFLVKTLGMDVRM